MAMNLDLKDEYVAGIGLVLLLQSMEGKNLVGAEIGVNRGITSQMLLENTNISMLYAIDPWIPYSGENTGTTHDTKELADEHYQETRARLKDFKDKVTLFVMTSKEAAKLIGDDVLDFIWIDGSHDYPSVKEDLNLWWPKVKCGGVFAGHDFPHPSVNKALMEFLRKQNHTTVKTGPNDMWYVLRTCEECNS